MTRIDRSSAVYARAEEVLAHYALRARTRAEMAPGTVTAVSVDIEEVAFCSGLEVVEYPDLPEGVLGVLDTYEETICVRPDLEPRRRAFVIAHEIGHYALGHEGRIVDTGEHVDERVGPDELVAADGVYRAYNSRDFMEIEANLFASKLLAPAESVLASIDENPGWTSEWLAERFGTSLTAMLARLTEVFLIRSEPAEEPAPEESRGAPVGASAATPPDLHPRQQEAVSAGTPALVVAGPGAGKTRVLAERYAHLLRSGRTPEEILALTFSNKAAEEMRGRVGSLVADDAASSRVHAYTFHSFCLELLKNYYPLVGLPENFTLLTETDALLLVRRRLSELDLAHFENLAEPGLHVPDILAAISRAKDELRGPEDFERLARDMCVSAGDEEQREEASKALEAARVYEAYQGWLTEEGYVDYGDLVHLSIEVLGVQGAAEEITDRYGQILVDEFQDINFASGRLVRALDRGRGVVWAVADPNQSIYRFRGASPANLQRFGDDYPGHRIIHLTKNYRSRPDIVGCSQGLRTPVSAGADPPGEAPPSTGTGDGDSHDGSQPPPLESDRPASEEPAVSLAVAPDGEAELEHLCDEVRRRRDGGVPLGEQAVLCSTNAQARRVVARLSAAGLEAEGPVSLLGGGEIKDALAVVSLLSGGGGAALVRVSGFEENPLTEEDAGRVIAWAREQGCGIREALSHSSEICGLGEPAAGFLAELGRFLGELPGWGEPWYAILAYAFHPESRLRPLLTARSEEARRRLLQLGQLALVARTFSEREDLVEAEGIPGFLEYVRELAALKGGNSALYAPPAPATDAVQVMTVHKSKGLEFPVVYVPNLARGRFPVRAGGGGGVPLPSGLAHHVESGGTEDEDRCLFYVAITRAEDELVLSRAEHYGKAAKPLPLMDSLVKEVDGRVMMTEHGLDIAEKQTGGASDRSPEQYQAPGRATCEPASYSFRQMERYGKCPRQFKYAEVLGLAEGGSGYQDFHNCIYRALSEMEVEARQTGENPSLEWARGRLGSIWEEEGPAGHFYESVYLRRAHRIIENWQAGGRALTWGLRQKMQLILADGAREGAQLEVTADGLGRDENGTLLIARHRLGQPRKSHREGAHQDLHALYAAAGRYASGEREVRVILHYLVGERMVDATPTERVISNRLEKISGRIREAEAGRYPPNPGPICKSCPYNLICPGSG